MGHLERPVLLVQVLHLVVVEVAGRPRLEVRARGKGSRLRKDDQGHLVVRLRVHEVLLLLLVLRSPRCQHSRKLPARVQLQELHPHMTLT